MGYIDITGFTTSVTTKNKVTYGHKNYIIFENFRDSEPMSMNLPTKVVHDEDLDEDVEIYDLDNAYVYAPVPSGNEGYMKPISGILRKIGKQYYSFETDDMHTGGNSSSINVTIFSGYDSYNNKPKLWINWNFDYHIEE